MCVCVCVCVWSVNQRTENGRGDKVSMCMCERELDRSQRERRDLLSCYLIGVCDIFSLIVLNIIDVTVHSIVFSVVQFGFKVLQQHGSFNVVEYS